MAAPDPSSAEETVVDMRSWRQVEVEVPADIVSRQWDTTVQEYTKVARVPGFRKGKVPASIIRSRFTDDIRTEVLEKLVPQYFRQAVEKEGFHPISQPRLHDLSMEPGNALRFKAAFEVMPDIELGNYHDIKVELPRIEVTDADVDNELRQLQERQSNFDPVDEERPLQDGDFAQVSFWATPNPDAPAAEPGAAQAAGATGQTAEAEPDQGQMNEVMVEIGGDDTLPEFTENFRGAKAGDERTFDIHYAEDFYEPRLAGQTLTYHAKVNAIKKKNIPELNDEFARELSPDFKTLDDLRTRIREGIEHERRHQVEHAAREKLMEALIQNHDFPVPETLVQNQIEFRLERGLRALAQQGMRMEDMKRLDMGRLRSSQRDAALKEVKSNLLLEKIADVENIQISDDELNQEIEILARQLNKSPETVRQQYTQNGVLESLRDRMRLGKTVSMLLSRASQTENGTV